MKRAAIALVLFSPLSRPLLGFAQAVLEDDIRDIRGPLPAPPAWWQEHESLMIARVAGLLAGVVAWIAVRLMSRAADPARVALDRLEAARAIAHRAGAKAFAHEVSEAVRAYVEARFAVRAPQRTTEELLSELAQDEGSPLARFRGSLADFLVCCDLAKFGGLTLREDEIDALVESARTFVEESAARPRRRARLEAEGGAR